MKANITVEINDKQKEIYEQVEYGFAKKYVSWVEDIINHLAVGGRNIKILDIGGGAGNFARLLKEKNKNMILPLLIMSNMIPGEKNPSAQNL